MSLFVTNQECRDGTENLDQKRAVDGPVSAAALLLSATVTDTVLRSDGDGAVRLQNAQGIVDRVLAIVEDADPTFPPLRQAPAM